jgi:cobalt-zinc-cadmium efflux system outer membrane protein
MDARHKLARILAMLMALPMTGCAWGAKHTATMPAMLPVVVTQGTPVAAPLVVAAAPTVPSPPSEPAKSTIVLASATEPATIPTVPQQPLPEAISRGAPIAVPQTFTLADLEGMALGNNPTLSQSSSRIQAARGNWQQVGRYPNPLIGYQGVEIGDEGRAGQQGIYVEQEFVMGRKRQLSQNAASQAVRQTEQEFEAQRMRVLNDVRIIFYQTLVAQRRVEIAQELLGIGEKGLDTTDRLLKAQEVSQADLLQSRIELNSVRLLSTNAQATYQSHWRQLAAVSGVPCLAQQPLVGDLNMAMCDLTWEAALQNVLSNSPEISAAYAGVERAKWALSRERAEPIPNVDVQVTAQHDNATTSDIAGVQAVLPLPLFNRNRGNIARAEAELAVAQREVNRVQLDLQNRLAITYGRYIAAKQAVDRYSTEILPDAKKSLDLISAGYRQGEHNFLVLLTAQRTYFQTNLAYLDAVRELFESRIAIDGLLLTGSLNPNAPQLPQEQPSGSYGVVPVMGRL